MNSQTPADPYTTPNNPHLPPPHTIFQRRSTRVALTVILGLIWLYLALMGFRILPVFGAMFEGMESRLPWTLRAAIHPLVSKGIPIGLALGTVWANIASDRAPNRSFRVLLFLLVTAILLVYLFMSAELAVKGLSAK